MRTTRRNDDTGTRPLTLSRGVHADRTSSAALIREAVVSVPAPPSHGRVAARPRAARSLPRLNARGVRSLLPPMKGVPL